MKKNTSSIIITMNVLFWIVFIGLCIQTGALLVSFLVGLISTDAGRKMDPEVDLSGLYRFGVVHYVIIVSLIVLLSALKAYMAYLVVKISMKINLAQPFSRRVGTLITQISHAALLAGIIDVVAQSYSKQVLKWDAALPILQRHIGSGGELLFLAGIIFIIAQVFKRGIELQAENDLTV